MISKRPGPLSPREIKSKTRCEWAGEDPLYCAYHDYEWGIPLHDDTRLFEMLILEGFQAGLSWLTVLKKRAEFEKAFSGWDYNKIARYDKKKINELLNNPGIIRNRRKIEAAVKNAGAFLKIREEFGSFDKYIWGFTEGKTIIPTERVSRFKDQQCTSPVSDRMSRDLKKRGFSFTGSVICYSFMQAVGMVDDHLKGCFKADGKT